MCFRSAGELRLAVSQSLRGPEAHTRARKEPNLVDLAVWIPSARTPTTQRERKCLYKAAVACVSCELATCFAYLTVCERCG